jgi:TPP-dependent pyruvate/acetoin dehydrogenase alpha subunit
MTQPSDTAHAPDTLERMYRIMVTIAAADARAHAEASSGALKAAYYPVQGLEAVCAAMGVATDASDALVSTYRNLGDAIAKGVSLRSIIGEFYGRVGGTSKGKGGPMHLVDRANGLMATSGIVGGGLPIAVGLALGASLDGDGRIAVATFGDGATSIGAFHESLNLASLWKLPIVFICQNNGWGEHTALRDYSPIDVLAQRAGAYGMRSVTVDGFDAPATLTAINDAVAHARSGAGPTLVECITYRLTPHVATAEMSYMPDQELAAARQRAHIATFRQWLADGGIVSPARLDQLEAEAAEAVDDAFDFALADAPPPAHEMFTDVYEMADPQTGKQTGMVTAP